MTDTSRYASALHYTRGLIVNSSFLHGRKRTSDLAAELMIMRVHFRRYTRVFFDRVRIETSSNLKYVMKIVLYDALQKEFSVRIPNQPFAMRHLRGIRVLETILGQARIQIMFSSWTSSWTLTFRSWRKMNHLYYIIMSLFDYITP